MTIWQRLLWPLLWAALCVAKDCSNRVSTVGVEGKDIVLSPSIADNGKLTRVYWKKGENLVASSKFSLGNQRLSLDSSSGKLLIKNLSKEDTGNYTAEIFINEKSKKTCFDLKILASSIQPDINCTVLNNDTIQLNCTSASQDLPLKYFWDYIRNEEIIHKNGPVIQLQGNPNDFQKITCYVTVFNLNTNNSINLSDCITLLKEPDHQSRSRLPSIAIPIILILILILVILFYCQKKCRKKREESKTINESESGAKNARENDKEESFELPEEERKSLTKSKLESVGEKEKSEEISMVEFERS